MNDTDDQDARDPLRAAFDDYQRAPRDIVPRTVEHSVDDLHLLANSDAQVTITHYEVDARGVTRHCERVTITAPFIESRKENR